MVKSKIGVIMGTTREGRFCDQATEWLIDLAGRNDDLDCDVIDLRDYPMPFFDESLAPLWTPARNEIAQAWNARIAGYDGYIFLTAEYNHGVPAVLKNALDHSYTDFVRKPAAFVGYGGVGAARAIEHLRLIVSELQMAPLRPAVHIGLAEFLGVLQQGKSLGDYPYLAEAANALFEDLHWWSGALARARKGN